MRSVLTLIIAGIVGSAAVGGLRSLMVERPNNPFQTVIGLYRQDKSATVKLIQEASTTCLPDLSSISSSKLRTVIPDMVAYLIEAKVQGRRLNKIEYENKIFVDILKPAMDGASTADIKEMADLIDQTNDRGVLVGCIAENVAQMASRPEKTLLDGVHLRGT